MKTFTLTSFFLGLLALFFLEDIHAADNWLCKEESSQRSGNSIQSCGIGKGESEDVARVNAFENSKKEFTLVCDNSDDCIGRKVSISPQRTSCEPTKNGEFICYRLVNFTIGVRTIQSEYAVERRASRAFHRTVDL